MPETYAIAKVLVRVATALATKLARVQPYDVRNECSKEVAKERVKSFGYIFETCGVEDAIAQGYYNTLKSAIEELRESDKLAVERLYKIVRYVMSNYTCSPRIIDIGT